MRACEAKLTLCRVRAPRGGAEPACSFLPTLSISAQTVSQREEGSTQGSAPWILRPPSHPQAGRRRAGHMRQAGAMPRCGEGPGSPAGGWAAQSLEKEHTATRERLWALIPLTLDVPFFFL